MDFSRGELGALHSLAGALGLLDANGQPNPNWLRDPLASLRRMLADDAQREALLAFVDEALGGGERRIDDHGAVWLPLVELHDPALTLFATVDAQADEVRIGFALEARTAAPASRSQLYMPLFRAARGSGTTADPLWLGRPGARMRLNAQVTVDAAPAVSGQAHLGSIGLELDLPTAPDDTPGARFGLLLGHVQLPGGTQPRDIRIGADGAAGLDAAALDLVLSLLRQAGESAPGTVVAGLTGLLGLASGDTVPDFPVRELATQGPRALAQWLQSVVTSPPARTDWWTHLATLLGVAPMADSVAFDLGSARLQFSLGVLTDAAGHMQLTPTVAVALGDADRRVQLQAQLLRANLGTGECTALPDLSLHALLGRDADGHRALQVAQPTPTRVNTLRLGLAMDAQRKPTLVLAADGVQVGAVRHDSLDLSSPGALMDALNSTVGQALDGLLAQAGTAADLIRQLTGLAPPAGIPALAVSEVLANPGAAISGYWQTLVANGVAMAILLTTLRDALADATQAAGAAVPIEGDGTLATPWRVPLHSGLALLFTHDAGALGLALEAGHSLAAPSLGGLRLRTAVQAQLARVNLATASGSVLDDIGLTLAVQGAAGEPTTHLALGGLASLEATQLGLHLAWQPAHGLRLNLHAPALALQVDESRFSLTLPRLEDGLAGVGEDTWDALQALIGALGTSGPEPWQEFIAALGWRLDEDSLAFDADADAQASRPVLRLAALVQDAPPALREWLEALAFSGRSPRVWAWLAQVLGSVLEGSGHPDDPYRFNLHPSLPNLALWFPPQGLAPRLTAASAALRNWRPGEPGLSAEVLADALLAEATVDAGVRAMVQGRELQEGLQALLQRWQGTDGRIAAPDELPADVTLHLAASSALQLPQAVDLPNQLGHTPTTTVYVAIGANAWHAQPAARRVALHAPGLAPAQLALPAAQAGDWFVELCSRTDGLAASSGTSDGTPEQAQRLQHWLLKLAGPVTVVAFDGAGHAARQAAQAVPAVNHVLMVGTPLGAISLTALNTQPTADTLRLLTALMPTLPTAADEEPDDDDLALGRGLLGALMVLSVQADPGAELRVPAVAPAAPRAGLTLTALMGDVSEAQAARALTALVAAGLAERAQARALEELPDPTGVYAGLRWQVAPGGAGTLAIQAHATLNLLGYDRATGWLDAPALRLHLRVGDRLAWLSAQPGFELRAVSLDLDLPLAAQPGSPASITLTLHEAHAFGQRWQALKLGNTAGALPATPEARALLSAAIQRVVGDAGNTLALALRELLAQLALLDGVGGVVPSALDALLLDPAALIQQRLAAAGPAIQAAFTGLLGGNLAFDLAQRQVRLQGGGDALGTIGWHADATATLRTGQGPGPRLQLAGQLRLGADAPVLGGMPIQLQIHLHPFRVDWAWRHADGSSDGGALWPAPELPAITAGLMRMAPAVLAAQVVQTWREADSASAQALEHLLDALQLLGPAPLAHAEVLDEDGSVLVPPRPLRSLLGLAGQPAAFFRQSLQTGVDTSRVQAMLDALRALLGSAGAAGSPLPLAPGVQLAVAQTADGPQLSLALHPNAWAAPAGAAARLALGFNLLVGLRGSGPPVLALHTHVGLPGRADARQAVHLQLDTAGFKLLLRPAEGADIPLVPFAGLGGLAGQAAQAALPFVLDQLATHADSPPAVQQVVSQCGDAFNLRTAGRFDGAKITAWAANPAQALHNAAPGLAAGALNALATALQGALPATVSAAVVAGELRVSVGAFRVGWVPGSQAVAVGASGLAVPGIETLSFALRLSVQGLDEFSAFVGPATIDAGGAVLRPFAQVAVGAQPAGGRRVAVGLAAGSTQRLAARWTLDGGGFALVASDGVIASAIDNLSPEAVALRVVEVMADLAAGMAMAHAEVQALLNTALGSGAVRTLLLGVLLDDANHNALKAQVFNPADVPQRIQRLFTNLAGLNLSFAIDIEGDKLEVGLARFAIPGTGDVIGVRLGVAPGTRFALNRSGDVRIWLENDARWIEGVAPGSAGLLLGLIPAVAALPTFAPALAVHGLGLRVGKAGGALVDSGIRIDSVGVHVYAVIDADGAQAGGAQVQFSGLAVPTTGAGGNNGIAQSVMRDAGPTPPRPAFSPALAVQKKAGSDVRVSLRAGDPPGPWWIAIQRGFGPLYLEQAGFGVLPVSGPIESISLLMDGRVSIFGLTCAVDDLQITYFTTRGDVFNPASWAVDLAGLAVSADMAGVTIAGGLLKQKETVNNQEQIQYLGMLMGRFGVYGLTLYGGYGEGIDKQNQKVAAFFAVGAVLGPIGGPPAFFLTGIGGGLGINRELVLPPMSEFTRFPLIEALDLAATPQQPMDQLRALGQRFPMQRGTFWFAAGISFNSFALIDGIAVVAVEFGDGLDVNLLGLARMALPRPQVALVSIELALLARISSKEGIFLVQGQLTDNSWLLYPDIKLTGGFAFAIWFDGEHRGECVITLGGYHPDFHRAHYPQVPRLGLRWGIGDAIVITSESYFALTSEALMAGGDFRGSAQWGPAWAEVKFGAHAIVFFDPFSYQAHAYARIDAGVTIDTWLFGEVSFSLHTGATIEVRGPDFRGKVRFEVGPVGLTFGFGGSDRVVRDPLLEAHFIQKYLTAAASGAALAHGVLTNTGAQPNENRDATPDGSAARPFVVSPEFSLIFTTQVPATQVECLRPGGSDLTLHDAGTALGVAPMGKATMAPRVVLGWHSLGAGGALTLQAFPFAAQPRPFGQFPAGVWGQPQDIDAPQLPTGEMIPALSELNLASGAASTSQGPPIAYHQVETGTRKPLPFTRSAQEAAGERLTAAQTTQLAAALQPRDADEAYVRAGHFLAGTRTPLGLRALRGEHQAPPRLGTLTEGLIDTTVRRVAQDTPKPPPAVFDHFVDAPVAVGLVHAGTLALRQETSARTTVNVANLQARQRPWRTAAPTLAEVQAQRSRSIAARLVVHDTALARTRDSTTLLATGRVPATAAAQGLTATVARRGAAGSGLLAGFTEGLLAARRNEGARATLGTPGATLVSGQVVMLKMPNARRDAAQGAERPALRVRGLPARVVMLAASGEPLVDVALPLAGGEPHRVSVPRGADRLAVLCTGSGRGDGASGLWGWHAGLNMPYIGHATALAAGCLVRSRGEPLLAHEQRWQAGWVLGSELSQGRSTVSTRFATPPRTVIIVLDDPAAFGDSVPGRRLALALQGARRTRDASGADTPPALLAAENRSLLAYDIEPEGPSAVEVNIASDEGWSVVAVMASPLLDARAALNRIAERGLDAALQPLAPAVSPAAEAAAQMQLVTALAWDGPQRSPEERAMAYLQATQPARAAALRQAMAPPAPPGAHPARQPARHPAAHARDSQPLRAADLRSLQFAPGTVPLPSDPPAPTASPARRKRRSPHA